MMVDYNELAHKFLKQFMEDPYSILYYSNNHNSRVDYFPYFVAVSIPEEECDGEKGLEIQLMPEKEKDGDNPPFRITCSVFHNNNTDEEALGGWYEPISSSQWVMYFQIIFFTYLKVAEQWR